MKLFFKSVFFGILMLLLRSTAYAQQQTPYGEVISSQGTPKLVVGIVVDQMRYEYITRFWDKFGDGGFKRLVQQGYNFSNHHFNYFPTYTGPGHSAIYTGTTPAVNGIVGNDWYDRQSGKVIYCVSDSTQQTVGAMDDAGAMSPHNLLSTTVTDELKEVRPESKVIGISIKDRAAILPAGHIADGAFWYDSRSGHFITSTWYAYVLPQWMKDFNRQEYARKYSQDVWKPLLKMSQYTESNQDDTPYERTFDGEDAPVFPHEMSGSLSRIKSSPYGNTLLRQAAEASLIGEDMGQDDVTDFLAVSFSSTDYVGHQFGPHSVELEDTYLRLDREMADFIDYLDKKVGKNNYVLFLTADHGVVDVPASLEDRQLAGGYFDSHAAIDSLKNHLDQRFGDAHWIASYLNQQVYLDQSVVADSKFSMKEIQQEAAQYLRNFPGVASTNTAYNLMTKSYEYGLEHRYQNGFKAARSGDVYIELKPGWLDSSSKVGTSHGSPYSYDTHVPLLFYGKNIPHGRTVRKTLIPQIAPTISAMLNITFPSGSENRPLHFE